MPPTALARRLAGAFAAAGVLTATLTLPATDSPAAEWPAPAAYAIDPSRGYDGLCGAEDSAGVSVVIDFGPLDGNDGRAAPTLTRCSPAPGNDANVRRTGLRALYDAGIVVAGTRRWGDDYPTNVSFACRIEGRPAADEPLWLEASRTTYTEPCGDTPPGDAYWSYWHADGSGRPWTYSELGLMNRYVQPGGFEGWRFSLNVHFTGDPQQNPAPEVAPVNPHRTPSPTPTTAPTTAPPTPSASPTTGTPTKPPSQPPGTQHATSAEARRSAGWLIGELEPAGQMPGPYRGTDWGLSIDAQWALYAAGTGARGVDEITKVLSRHVGEYVGTDLFEDAEARIGGSVAKLLVAAVVAGADPESFGTGRYLPAGQRFDLRAETLDLLEPRGVQAGRIRNVGTGKDETNLFAQSLAVIGLARSGGVPPDAVDFLLSQQCREGWFRMFYNDRLSCDQARQRTQGAAADTDGTAMALQALLTARANGSPDLDDAIRRAAEWLLAAQHRDGSFGGGVSTTGSNSNSTGLAASALWAAAQEDPDAAPALSSAYVRARDWVLSLHAREATARGSALARDYGAIGYSPPAFADAREHGIGAGERDQWRRATAQAVLALAPVSFRTLGTVDPEDESGTPAPTQSPPAVRPAPQQAGRRPPPRTPGAPEPSEVGGPPDHSAAGRLAGYLSRRLVGGDHAETRIDGTTYVDYDTTVDVLLALRALDRLPATVRRTTDFLLHPRAVAAYAHGRDQSGGPSAFVEPLSRLLLVARFAQHDRPEDRRLRTLARTLGADLARLDTPEGPVDSGAQAGDPQDTTTLAWAVLGARARSADHAARPSEVRRWARRLVAAQCADGRFAARLDDPEGCRSASSGEEDTARTLVATRALAAVPGPGAAIRRARWLSQASRNRRLTPRALLTGRTRDVGPVVAAAALRRLAGLDIGSESSLFGRVLLPGGGLPATTGAKRADPRLSLAGATVIAGRDWSSAAGSPVVPAPADPGVLIPAQEPSGPPGDPATGERPVSAPVLLGAGAAGGLLVALLLGLLLRARARPPRRTPTTDKERHV